MPVLEQVTVKIDPKVARNSTAESVGFVAWTVSIVLLAIGFLVFVYVVGQGLAGKG
jgi:hypothetical protein